ncbi:hypothetical protein C3E98_019270 [Pseudomonas sp. MWU13-2625]|nr:hypothetical protein C3E98_019270 [Pseudomonas sp. MWU13-2625]
MKVTDEEILQAIWRAQVKKTANGVITNYVGGGKALSGSDSQRYAQGLHMISRRAWGVPLSYAQLRRRTLTLIKARSIPWHTGFNGSIIWIDDQRAKAVFEFARQWWRDQGVPEGFDEQRKRMRTVQVDEFGEKVEQLEAELLERFGKLEVTP